MLYLAFAVEILIIFALLVIPVVLLIRQPGVSWGLILAGVVAFVGSQVVHLPLNLGLGLLGGGSGVALWPLPLVALVAGLSAGICEEGARYLVLRFWRREARSWIQGVAFGTGHGGVEALFTAGLVLVTFVNMIILRQVELETLGLTGDILEQAQTQVEAYWSMAWYLPLLGGLERVFALAIQIALSLLVVQALTCDNLAWLLAAVGAHALVDGIVIYLGGLGWSPPMLEGVVLLFALGALALILTQRPGGGLQAARHASDVSRENST